MKGLCERLFHRYDVAVADDDPLELRNVRPFGQQKHRFDIEKGLIDWDDKEIATDHAGTALVPQCELARDCRVLIDQGFDLKWPKDEVILRQFVDNQLAITGGNPIGQRSRRSCCRGCWAPSAASR